MEPGRSPCDRAADLPPTSLMTSRPVLVDVTRLISRLDRGAPTGIDRVDHAYARRYLADGGGQAVARTPVGARLLPPARVTALLGALETRWAEPGTVDRAFDRVRRWLEGPPARAGEAARERGDRARLALDRPLRAARALSWARAAEAPRGALFLHTSHLGLDRDGTFAWLDRRPDIRPVFFVHDLIPIDFPEYGRPGAAGRHRLRMAQVGRRAAAVLVNSRSVADRLGAHLSETGARPIPITVAPLGVETDFSAAVTPIAATRPYFVLLSTIEARKNHLLILQVWRELARRRGPATPALVVIGRRGWESEAAVDLLDRCEAIAPHVTEASGLSTASVAALVAGARALLMPSFAEGYGIPVVEALSLGTPVVASDIPVHREVAGDRATFLDPLDGPGWLREIAGLAERPRAGPDADPYARPTWDAHFRIVDDVLSAV